jgi:hypothetical protein
MDFTVTSFGAEVATGFAVDSRETARLYRSG